MAEANFAVNLSRLSLCAVGVWPNLKCSRVYALVSNLVFVTSVLFISYFIVIAQTTKLFLIGGDLDTIVDILCTADIPVCVAVIKMIVLRHDSEVVKSLLCKMFDDWKSSVELSSQAIMRESARTGRRIAAACVGLAYGTSNVFFLLRLVLLRQKQGRTGIRAFLFESYFPLLGDVSATPGFEIIWLLQGFCTFSATTAYSGIDSFFAVLVLHLCGQLTILRHEVDELATTDNGSKAETQADIARIVKRHNELNRFAQTIEKTFNRMFLVQIIACVVQFCLQGYQIVSIVMDKTVELPLLQLIFMAMYICYMSLDLYIYCYVAEKLRQKSLELSNAAYNCKWYSLTAKEAQDIMLIMKRSQYPLEITAGKFCTLSLNLFAIVSSKIGKTSLGYLSMLLAVKERTQKTA